MKPYDPYSFVTISKECLASVIIFFGAFFVIFAVPFIGNKKVPERIFRRMKGNRIDADKNGNLPLNYGDYGKDGNRKWYGKPPGFKSGYANLSNHNVVEHNDGTITVSPSILVENHTEKWHGFLEHGVWREC